MFYRSAWIVHRTKLSLLIIFRIYTALTVTAMAGVDLTADEGKYLSVGCYFRAGNASAKFNAAGRYVRMRFLCVMERRGGQGRPNYRWQDWFHSRLVEEHGLHKLLGTVRYPGGTHAA